MRNVKTEKKTQASLFELSLLSKIVLILLAVPLSISSPAATTVSTRLLTVTTIAGQAGKTGSGNGTGTNALFNVPTGLALDSSGNLYVADGANQIIRKIAPGGAVTTFAGSAGVTGTNDGVGTSALFNYPSAVAVDTGGSVYVADSGNNTIRRISPSQQVTTLAGLGGTQGSADGMGSNARFFEPNGIAVDGAGIVYVADTGNSTIRRITPAGEVSTLAGRAGSVGSADGTGNNARFFMPYGVAVDLAGGIYVTDTYNNTFRKVTPQGQVTTLAGLAGSPGSADGTGSAARFYYPDGAAAVDTAGNVYLGDFGNNITRVISPGGVVTTLAGLSGSPGSANGTGTAVRFNGPAGLAVDGAGNIYIADSNNNTVRKGVLNVPFNTAAPQAFTGVASAITSNSASVGGTVGPGALTTWVWFQFGTNALCANNTATQSVGSYTSPVGITTNLTNLSQSTTFYFGLVASNASGVSVGNVASFTTSAALVVPNPALTTAIIGLHTASVTALNLIGQDAAAAAAAGDYFNEQAVNEQIQLPSDVLSTVYNLVGDFSSTDVNLAQDGLTSFIEVAVPTILEGTDDIVYQLKAENPSGCNAGNLFDTNWLSAIQTRSSVALSSEIADHGNKVMAAMSLGEPIEGVSANAESAALGAIFDSTTGLTSIGVGFHNCVIPGLEQDLAGRTNSILNGIPAMSSQEQSAWASNLTVRGQVPFVYVNVFQQYAAFLSEYESANKSYESYQWFPQALQTFAGELADFLSLASGGEPAPKIFVDEVDGAVNTFVDTTRLSTLESLYEYALITQWRGFDSAGQIWANEAGAIAEISTQLPPQTVTGEVLGATHYSQGAPWGVCPLCGGWNETSSYSEITLTNKSNSSAVFRVFVRYSSSQFVVGLGSFSDLPLVTTASDVLGPGQGDVVAVNYMQNQTGLSPDTGSQILIDIVANNNSGAFYVGGLATAWQPTQVLASGSQGATEGSTRVLAPDGGTSTNGLTPIANPIVSSVTYSSSNQAYGVQLLISNPFNLPVTAIVTQPLATNVTVLSTDGVFENSNSSIIWTNMLMPFTRMPLNFAFSYPAPLGSTFALPPAALTLQDPVSRTTLNTQGNAPQFTAMSPVDLVGNIPVGISGIGTAMQIAVTNLTSMSQTGSVTIAITGSNGVIVYSSLQSFLVGGSTSSVLTFTLPSTVPPGLYSLTATLNINGGSTTILTATYQELSPLTLSVDSPAWSTNGAFNLVLYVPVSSNYVIQASTNLLTWWTVTNLTNASSPINISFPDATNYQHLFFRAGYTW